MNRFVLGLAVGLVSLSVAACGGAASSPTTTTQPPTDVKGVTVEGPAEDVRPSDPARAELLRAYETMFDWYAATLRADFSADGLPNPADPTLPTVFSGDALAEFTTLVSNSRAQGVRYTGSVAIGEVPLITYDLPAREAVITDCITDSMQPVDAASGVPLAHDARTNQPTGQGALVAGYYARFRAVNNGWYLVEQQWGYEDISC